MNLFAQGFGGFGGPRTPPGEDPWEVPDRAPDAVVTQHVGLNQSLIYRLTGDRHPHGTVLERAQRDGFDRPVLYGLGTYGFACRALLGELCSGTAQGFHAMHARFSKPVYPGDRLDTQIWKTETGARFRTIAAGERVVLDRGTFTNT
jgi:acyl dehydratase